MPEILVIKNPEDQIDDRIPVDEEDLGNKVQELYTKLDYTYSLEIIDDNSPRTRKR